MLKHYVGGEVVKQQAATYLVQNMYLHQSIHDPAYSAYAIKIRRHGKAMSTPELNSLWTSSRKVRFQADSKVLSARQLIEDIDAAFAIRDSCPWKEQIPLEVFNEYILPYKVSTGTVIPGWRKTLHQKYKFLTEGVTDPKTAFVKVMKYLQANTREVKSNFPYDIDPLTMDLLQRGTCAQLDAYTVAVLRALCIPAAYDYIDSWGNYSRVGHSWVAFIDSKGRTLTLHERDSVLRKFNPINASYFKEHYQPEDVHINVSRYKTVYKVYRKNFAVMPDERKWLKNQEKAFYHRSDVSAEYGLNRRVELPTKGNIVYATLSVFMTGSDWREFDMAESRNGKVVFEHLGANVMYLPVFYDDIGLKRIGIPFYIDNNGQMQRFNKVEGSQTVTLYRKYPLFGNWTAQWKRMVGGVLESSDSPDFHNSRQLYRIDRIPLGNIRVTLPKSEKMTYIRYRCPPDCRTSIAEFTVYRPDSQEVDGVIPIGHLIKEDQLSYAFDGDVTTFPDIKNTEYWIGLDLTSTAANDGAMDIGSINLLPKNDGNFVVEGNEYELFFFDRRWISLGKQVAETDSLSYNAVPTNVVFLLKNLTGGSEERIFTLDNGKQVWW